MLLRTNTIFRLLLLMFMALPAMSIQAMRQMGSLTLETGLTGQSANKVVIDHLGGAWVATSNGVTFFNGVKASRVPFFKNGHSEQMGRLFVYDLCQVPGQVEFFATTPSGLYRFNLTTGNFKWMRDLPDKSNMLWAEGRLYVCNSMGLSYYEDGVWHDVPLTGNHEVKALAWAGLGELLLITSDALCRYFVSENRTQRKPLDGLLPKEAVPGSLAEVGGNIYIGTKNYGLYRIDGQTGQASHIGEIGNVVSSLQRDSEGHLCVATDGTGAYLLDGQTGLLLRHYDAQTTDGEALSTNALYHYCRDSHGVEWFSMAYHGLQYTYHQSGLFTPYAFGDFSTSGTYVRSICIDGQRRLIGTASGLHYIDEQAGTVRHYDASHFGGGHLITSIARHGDNYYIGTYDNGLHRMEANGFDIQPVTEVQGVSVLTMRESPDHQLWIGTGYGVYIIGADGTTRHLTAENSALGSGSVNSLMFSPDGSVWLGGGYGLSVIQADGTFLSESTFPTDFPLHERCLTISRPDTSASCYLGNWSGIYHARLDLSTVERLSLPAGILDEGCNALYTDDAGGLWIASEKGLFRTDTHRSYTQHFGFGDGLPSRVVSKDGIVATGDTLWIATGSGLMLFSKQRFATQMEQTDYQVLLYDLMVGEQRMEKADVSRVSTENRLCLSWNFGSQNLRTRLVLNDFARPGGRLFEYRLQGDTAWHLVMDSEELKLGSLSMGTHQLTVRLAGIPGTETHYTVTVLPSVWAILELVLIIVGVVLLLTWRRYYKTTRLLLRERNEIEDVLVELEQQEALREEQQEEEEVMQATVGLAPEAAITSATGKYQQLNMSDEACADIRNRLDDYFQRERPYRNPDLRRADVAEVLHVSVPKLSYVLSMYMKDNFPEYVNRHRLEEFKRLVVEGAYRRFTITALSEQCGFKKSSFFSTFRKVEGMTPTEYLHRQNISVSTK